MESERVQVSKCVSEWMSQRAGVGVPDALGFAFTKQTTDGVTWNRPKPNQTSDQKVIWFRLKSAWANLLKTNVSLRTFCVCIHDSNFESGTTKEAVSGGFTIETVSRKRHFRSAVVCTFSWMRTNAVNDVPANVFARIQLANNSARNGWRELVAMQRFTFCLWTLQFVVLRLVSWKEAKAGLPTNKVL